MSKTPRGKITRDLILDVAEKLFAANGPAAVTIRSIAAAASVNTQAVNYHFGSKDRLFEEMFARRVGPVNAERLALLDACTAKGRKADLEQVLDAFVRPLLRLRQGAGRQRAAVVMQFMARALALQGDAEFAYLQAHFEPVRNRFITALCAILPGLGIEDVIWRYNFMCGAMTYAMGGPARMTRLPASLAGAKVKDADDEAAAIEHLVRFLSAGFRAEALYGRAERSRVRSIRSPSA